MITTHNRINARRACLEKWRNAKVLAVLRFGRDVPQSCEVRMHERVIAAKTGLSRLQVKFALYDLSHAMLVARAGGHAWALHPEIRS